LITLSPVVFLKHLNTNWDLLSILYRLGSINIMKYFNVHRLPISDPAQNPLVHFFMNLLSKYLPFSVEMILFFISDRSPSLLDISNFAFYLQHYPADSSLKCLDHFGQLSQLPEGEFRKFDYGKEKNLKKYGTAIPPAFDLSKVTLTHHYFLKFRSKSNYPYFTVIKTIFQV
jgi:lysosomal acid lipase/cholesteryl ester hydrolase